MAGLFWPRLHIGLIDLNDIRAAREQILDLLVDRYGIIQRHRFFACVEVILRLLGHGVGPGHGRLNHTVGVLSQELDVSYLDRLLSTDLSNHARDWVRVTAAIECGAWMFHVNAFKRRGKAIGIAFPADLAVGDDVDTGALLIAYGEERRVILRPHRRKPHLTRRASESI